MRLTGIVVALAFGNAAATPPAPDLLDRAADAVDLAREAGLRITCIERVREARYDGSGEAVSENERTFHWDLERDGAGLAAVRAKPGGRVVAGPDAAFGDLRWPDSHAWLGILGRENRGFFRFDDLGLDRATARLAFRGALPYDHGDDVREWEGRIELDPQTGRILAIEAAPSSQLGRGIKRFDLDMKKTRWVVKLFGGTIAQGRFGRRPKAAAARVRMQTSSEGTALPGEVRYETLRWARRGVTALERAQLRIYEDCRRVEAAASDPALGDRVP